MPSAKNTCQCPWLVFFSKTVWKKSVQFQVQRAVCTDTMIHVGCAVKCVRVLMYVNEFNLYSLNGTTANVHVVFVYSIQRIFARFLQYTISVGNSNCLNWWNFEKKKPIHFFLNVVFVSITFLFRSIIVEWWCATTHRIKVPLESDWVVYGLECMFREREGDGWAERSHVSNAWMWLSNQCNETTKNSTNLLILQAFSADVNNTWRN